MRSGAESDNRMCDVSCAVEARLNKRREAERNFSYYRTIDLSSEALEGATADAPSERLTCAKGLIAGHMLLDGSRGSAN